MQDEKYYFDEIKKRFDEYVEEQRYIDDQIERYERLYSKTYDISASEITDMPKAPSPVMDKFSTKIETLQRLEKEIKELINLHSELRKQIEEVLSILKDADERTVMQMRYLDGFSWIEITDAMFSGEKNYDNRFDTFQRRVFQQRENAIKNLSKYVLDKKESSLPAFLMKL